MYSHCTEIQSSFYEIALILSFLYHNKTSLCTYFQVGKWKKEQPLCGENESDNSL